MSKFLWRIQEASCKGDRETQQDCRAQFYDDGALLMVIADGAGGLQEGAAAARVAIAQVEQLWFQSRDILTQEGRAAKLLEKTMLDAHDSILSIEGCDKMIWSGKSAMIILYVEANGRYCAASVGNCGLYQKNEGQWLRRSKESSICKTLGTAARPKVRMIHGRMDAGDSLLVCSDGLWDQLPKSTWTDPSNCGKLADDFASSLLKLAYDSAEGKSDNISVMMCSPAPASSLAVSHSKTALVIGAIALMSLSGLASYTCAQYSFSKKLGALNEVVAAKLQVAAKEVSIACLAQDMAEADAVRSQEARFQSERAMKKAQQIAASANQSRVIAENLSRDAQAAQNRAQKRAVAAYEAQKRALATASSAATARLIAEQKTAKLIIKLQQEQIMLKQASEAIGRIDNNRIKAQDRIKALLIENHMAANLQLQAEAMAMREAELRARSDRQLAEAQLARVAAEELSKQQSDNARAANVAKQSAIDHLQLILSKQDKPNEPVAVPSDNPTPSPVPAASSN